MKRQGPATKLGALIALCAVSTVVGCATDSPSHSNPSGNSSGLQTDSLAPFSSGPIAHLPDPAPGNEISASDAAGGISMPWKFLGFVATQDAVTVAYVGGDGDCTKPVGFYVHKDGSDVVVEAVSKEDTGRTACADRVVMAKATVKLPTPIGGSVHLVHAATDSRWNSPSFFK